MSRQKNHAAKSPADRVQKAPCKATAIGGACSFLTGCRVHFLVLKEIRRNAQEVDTAGPSADQPHTRLLAAPRNGRTTPLYGWRQGDIPESALADTVYGITAGHPFCAFSGDGQLHELARNDRFIPSVAVVPYADEDAPPFTAPENGTAGTNLPVSAEFCRRGRRSGPPLPGIFSDRQRQFHHDSEPHGL